MAVIQAMAIVLVATLMTGASADEPAATLPGTTPLTTTDDPAVRMVAGINTYLKHAHADAPSKRASRWSRDYSSHEAYIASVQPNRERLQRITGVVDERLAPSLERVAPPTGPLEVGVGTGYQVYSARWSVLDGVDGDGLLLEPDSPPTASVVALPDCDWLPEQLAGLMHGVPESVQFARRLAESGCRVLVPTLASRSNVYSVVEGMAATDQPHREFIYRPAYQMGRHVIGYEVQKVLAAVDWFKKTSDTPVGVYGYGEGGLIAFYAAALDTRIDAVVVSGYFRPRTTLWDEPIYRNIWSLLTEFGDAEVASLIAPRTLVIEAAAPPAATGPTRTEGRRKNAAPGAIPELDTIAVEREYQRAQQLVSGLSPQPPLQLIMPNSALPGDAQTVHAFQEALGVQAVAESGTVEVTESHDPAFAEARQKRQVRQLLDHTQRVVDESDAVRTKFWENADAKSLDTWRSSTEWYRTYFYDEVIGRLPEPNVPLNPRSRVAYDTEQYTAYEVELDVYPTVFAQGLLLLPKDIAAGEQRPVVVCQHGLEGRPEDLADPTVDSPYYHQYACRLAERGFVVFAPQNPYIGADDFRVLQRMANPLKLSLFSFITRQHERILEWLGDLPFVDAERIGFYGLSYGGKTAVRVPALLDGYYLSICSGDWNEWIWKTASFKAPYVYQFTHEYEMYEWNVGQVFNYGELTGLVAPRPFMVERGHRDGVSVDEWVLYEYAHVRRLYDDLGIGDRTEIEVFDGVHEINAKGTFDFLHKHLRFGAPAP